MFLGFLSSYRLLLICSLASMVLLSFHAPWPTSGHSHDALPPDLEERAHDLNRSIMCPKCAGQTLDQSQSQIAGAMRDSIRQRLLAGETDESIVDALIASYGETILASPPTRGFSIAAWVVPPAAILIGAVVLVFAVRSMRNPRSTAPIKTAPETWSSAQIDRYLDLVDGELSDDTSDRRRA